MSQSAELLKSNLKYLGFGENLHHALDAKINEKLEGFTLGATAAFPLPNNSFDKVNYELRFNKSPSGAYILDNYQATLIRGKELPVSQVFFLNIGQDFTAKEAYNLIAGRGVRKIADIIDKLTLVRKYKEDMSEKELEGLSFVSDVNEARKQIELFLNDKQYFNLKFELKSQEVDVKLFDGNGKELPLTHSNITLIHSYQDRITGETMNYPSSHKSIEAAKEKVKELIQQVDKQTIELQMLKGNVVFARYNAQGQEIPYTPPRSKHPIWLQLDFSQRDSSGLYPFQKYYPHYGFDLSAILNDYRIADVNNPQVKDKLLTSLQRGNLEGVVMMINGKKENVYISANPQLKNISVFDKSMKLLDINLEEHHSHQRKK